MKINEVADVAVHPAVKKEQEFVNLLKTGEEAFEEIIEFIMDDRNAESRRLLLLRHLDELQGDVKNSYDASSLEDFMHDQGPSDWQGELRDALKKYSADGKSYSWSHNKEYPPGTQYDFSKIDDMSEKEMIKIAKDLKIPPYHLSSVDEQFDDETPTGEYEVCNKCGGEGTVYWDHVDEFTGEHQPASAPCPNCEAGLIDVTGEFKLPDFDA